MALTLIGAGGRVSAQSTADTTGVIEGTVRLVTPDAAFEPTTAQLIMLREGQAPEAIEQPVETDGHFAFEAEADPTITYLVLVEYAGIQYFSNSLLLSPELPSLTLNFDVFAVSTTAPAMTIDSTEVTLVAIDRENSQLTLIREDFVRHDEPIVYVGGEDGVTLRLPAPDGTVDADGRDDGSTGYAFEAGTVAVTIALRPGVTSVVTRYTVRYERDEDRYRLRITAPLDTDHMQIRIPERFMREVSPQSEDAARAPDADFEGEPLTVIERTTPARPGQGLVVALEGLAGVERASNPLTSRSGGAAGLVLALIVITGLAIGLHRGLRGRTA